MHILNCSDSDKKLKSIESSRSGFTLIELLVVMSLTMILTGGLLTYNKASENQLVLYRDDQKILGALQQAKALAFGIIGDPSHKVCGYGVHLDQNGTVTVFKDLSPTGNADCTDANNIYGLGGDSSYVCDYNQECVSQFQLDKTLQFSGPLLNDIVYIPPDPTVIINNDVNKPNANITINLKSAINIKKTISVNNSGQITDIVSP